MTGLDISLLTMGSAFGDHFKLGNHQEGRRENCCGENVSSSRFASLGDQTNVSWVDDKNSRGETSGVFGRSERPTSGFGDVSSGGESRHCRTTMKSSSGSFQLRGTDGSLSRFYERLAVTWMECVTS